jgi:hypothetical protein
MKIYIVGEDLVTYAIIKRILSFCSDKFDIISELPARGGQIKSKIKEFNKLSATYPVVLLTDLDASSCAPQLINNLMPENKHENFILNIAVDEGEAWLMADREGFANYFGLDINKIPTTVLTKQGGNKALNEMNFPCKSSWFLTHELIKTSKKSELIKQLTPKQGASKGPEYNTGILPFIQERWNITNACINSDSLTRMVSRIKLLVKQ